MFDPAKPPAFCGFVPHFFNLNITYSELDDLKIVQTRQTRYIQSLFHACIECDSESDSSEWFSFPFFLVGAVRPRLRRGRVSWLILQPPTSPSRALVNLT